MNLNDNWIEILAESIEFRAEVLNISIQKAKEDLNYDLTLEDEERLIEKLMLNLKEVK